MFGHCFLGPIFVGAASNAFPIGKHQPLMKRNFPDDVLGHFERPGSESIVCYTDSVAGLLTPIR
jgi:hypothetical protein